MHIIEREFIELIDEIVKKEEYQPMRDIKHHNESVYQHCFDTAYMSYKIAKKMNLDCKSIVRGSLLHDFYLYKFEKGKGAKAFTEPFKHIYNHPKTALANASRVFDLNLKEKDIISKHMFPFAIPMYLESWVVTLVDKILATAEYYTRVKGFMKRRYARA